MGFAVKQYAAVLQDMLSCIIANQDKITDFNEGSVVGSFCEAVALEVEQLYILGRVGFENNLLDVPFYAFDFTKQPAASGAGEVTFSRPGSSGTIDIPQGTLVGTSAGIKFETTEDGEISDGNTESSAIGIAALEAGQVGNVPAATITQILTPITGVTGVSNAAATTGGQDEETDAEYLKRFREFVEGLGKSSVAGLVAGAKLVEGVRSASVVEHFPPVSGYNATMYIDDGAGNASSELIASVEEALIGDGTESKPGRKGAGINLRVLAPSKVTITVTATVTSDGTLSDAVICYNIKQALSDHINNLLIGEDVIRMRLIEVIMGVTGVADIDMTVPASNTTISDTQIARVTDGDMTISFA